MLRRVVGPLHPRLPDREGAGGAGLHGGVEAQVQVGQGLYG